MSTIGNGVFAEEVVPLAIYAFIKNYHSYQYAIIGAVNLAGDTDTIAAMVGVLAGAYHGVDGIPANWLSNMEQGGKGLPYIEDLAKRLFQTWNKNL